MIIIIVCSFRKYPCVFITVNYLTTVEQKRIQGYVK
jgi:hypothetical protein